MPGLGNKKLYNGKDLVDNFGLNWYHYGARWYDPQLGKWTTMDPADEFNSPYCYVGNDPTYKTDKDGAYSLSWFKSENGVSYCSIHHMSTFEKAAYDFISYFGGNTSARIASGDNIYGSKPSDYEMVGAGLEVGASMLISKFGGEPLRLIEGAYSKFSFAMDELASSDRYKIEAKVFANVDRMLQIVSPVDKDVQIFLKSGDSFTPNPGLAILYGKEIAEKMIHNAIAIESIPYIHELKQQQSAAAINTYLLGGTDVNPAPGILPEPIY